MSSEQPEAQNQTLPSEQPEVQSQTLPSEQPEVHSQTLPHAEDITQQATSLAPKTHVKNPKRVAAGKMVAARTKKNKEEQKKKNAEAALANKNEKSAVSEPKDEEESGLTVNQLIGIGGLVVSVVGLLKRDEIMATVRKNLPSPPSPSEPTPAPPPVETETQRKVLRKMD